MEKIYADFAWEQAAALLAIDSPSGYTVRAAAWVRDAFAALGFGAHITTKGGVLVDLGGETSDNALLLSAHTDTLGGMVAQIKGNGRLRITSLGGMNACNGETENVRVYTREGKVIEGTLQLCNASVHVNGGYNDAKRSFDTTEILLDAQADSAEDVKKLGIQVGDIVCFEPRTRRTDSGYLKSRFLDDKLSVGILLGFAKYLADNIEAPYLCAHHCVRGGRTRWLRLSTGRCYRGGCCGHGLCRRWTAVYRTAGVYLRKGFWRTLQLCGSGGSDRSGKGCRRGLCCGCLSLLRL